MVVSVHHRGCINISSFASPSIRNISSFASPSISVWRQEFPSRTHASLHPFITVSAEHHSMYSASLNDHSFTICNRVISLHQWLHQLPSPPCIHTLTLPTRCGGGTNAAAEESEALREAVFMEMYCVYVIIVCVYMYMYIALSPCPVGHRV